MTQHAEIEWTPPLATVVAEFMEMAERSEHLGPAFEDSLRDLEDVHRAGFATLAPRYVKSGRLRASLTGQGAGSIREVSDDDALFGTSVSYAQYLAKQPREPDIGQIDQTRGSGQYAVLLFPKLAQRRVAGTLLGYITEPFGE
jgi:hypothetical protein